MISKASNFVNCSCSRSTLSVDNILGESGGDGERMPELEDDDELLCEELEEGCRPAMGSTCAESSRISERREVAHLIPRLL